jgi:hypothetical protein
MLTIGMGDISLTTNLANIG